MSNLDNQPTITYHRVIRASSLPMRCPLMGTLLYYMAMDHFGAPGWLYGVVGFVMAFVWVAWLYGMFYNEAADCPGFGRRTR